MKHVFACPLRPFKDRDEVKFYELAESFLKQSKSSFHSVLVVRYDDPAWLAEHMSRLTYDGGRVHLCFSVDRFLSILRRSEDEWSDNDNWIDTTVSDERKNETLRRNRAKGIRVWSESSQDFLLRIIQRPLIRLERKEGNLPSTFLPACTIRVVGWNSESEYIATLKPGLQTLLNFMKTEGRFIPVPR